MTFFHLILNRSYNLMFISINLGLFGICHVFSLNFQEDIQTFKFSLTEQDFFFFLSICRVPWWQKPWLKEWRPGAHDAVYHKVSFSVRTRDFWVQIRNIAMVVIRSIEFWIYFEGKDSGIYWATETGERWLRVSGMSNWRDRIVIKWDMQSYSWKTFCGGKVKNSV